MMTPAPSPPPPDPAAEQDRIAESETSSALPSTTPGLWRPNGPTAPPVRRRPDLRLIFSIAAAVAAFFVGLIVGLASGGSDGAGASDPDIFESAKETCASGSSDIRIGDDGDTLSIDRAGAEEMPGATLLQLDCLLEELDVPYAVVDRIQNTRALDGYQEATFDGLTATWNYHPDDGLNMTVTRVG
ncbi:hypothetical protein K3N28_01110 [Glycomyces sp. TRM65418]|uniref:hypothetical protein n=1 Tax=Glycomyces sp. TRM65418 TaxID=2867006 RepID=UPI001CE704BB|nr:hypothetical protein [Glycomyces sp. TRM65418]MCC3761672.1 hypothetical protein [Glycomyces sp. TRM65418]QZD55766.1 hypothetical protein K3N28_01100 [Glycomyces sp. TRM65418]